MIKLIEVRDLTFLYPGSDIPALDNINLTVNKGEFIGITGPAGAGKSTLSLCFNGVIPHFQRGKMAGQVFLKGCPVSEIFGEELASTVGNVFQDPETQIVSMNVEEEIAFGMENLGFDKQLMLERIDEVLKMTGIESLRYSSTTALSGGQKQRVVIAAALAMMPEILVLDEPASELDPVGTEELFSILSKLNKSRGITIIVIEQRIDQLAGYLDRLLVLDRGKLVADGHPCEVLAKPEIISLGVKIPQVSEFALLFGGDFTEVPITLEQGIKFIQTLLRDGGQ